MIIFKLEYPPMDLEFDGHYLYSVLSRYSFR